MNKFEYRPVAPKNTKTSTSKDNTNETSTSRQLKKRAKVVNTSNVFGVLCNLDDDSIEKASEGNEVNDLVNDDSDGEVEEVCNETTSFMASGSPSTIPLIARINELESHMLDGSLC